jgi:hypothetical protein
MYIYIYTYLYILIQSSHGSYANVEDIKKRECLATQLRQLTVEDKPQDETTPPVAPEEVRMCTCVYEYSFMRI